LGFSPCGMTTVIYTIILETSFNRASSSSAALEENRNASFPRFHRALMRRRS
jgi:hypothetical protein